MFPDDGRSAGDTSGHPTGISLAALLAVFAASLLRLWQTIGTSPHLWVDGVEEDRLVDDCLRHSLCTTLGQRASIPVFHGGGYIDWRTLMTWLGLGTDGTYLIIFVATAAGVALTALAAGRLAGPSAAALASLLMILLMYPDYQYHVVSNIAPLIFLGALFLALSVSTAQAPTSGTFALTGALGGVIANTHAMGAACAFSVVWLAIFTSNRPRRHAFIGLGSFALVAFALSPDTWIVNVQQLFSGSVSGNFHGKYFRIHDFMLPVAIGTAGAWCFATFKRRTRYRHSLDVPVGIFFPIVAVLCLGNVAGYFDAKGSYVTHVLSAIAAGGAVAVIGWFRFLRDRSWSARFEYVAPYAAAGIIAFACPVSDAAAGILGIKAAQPVATDNSGFPLLTFADLRGVARVLRDERKWGWTKTALRLKSTSDSAVIDTLAHLFPEWPEGTGDDNRETAYLLKLQTAEIPNPLPPNAALVHSTAADGTILVFARSAIDWSSFRVCSQAGGEPAEKCIESSLPTAMMTPEGDLATAPGMPGIGGSRNVRLTLHFPLHGEAAFADERIYMPRLPRLCPGALDAASPAEVAITWNLEANDCRSYVGTPPFFVEGNAGAVELIQGILRSHEK